MDSLANLTVGEKRFALTRPIKEKGYREPKNFLMRMTPETVREYKRKGKPFQKARTSCVQTETGRRFCLFTFEKDGKKVTLEGMQMGMPTCEFKYMAKGMSEDEAADRCIKEGKEAFLIVQCKPEEFCKK